MLGGVAAAAALSFGRVARSTPLADAAPAAAHDVIAVADASFGAAAEEFAEEAQRLGIAVRGFAHDVGTLWLREIGPALRAGSATLVGLTGAGVLLCLETLARGEGFATIFRAERPPAGRGWPSVAARHAFAAAGAAAPRGAPALAPIEHCVAACAAEPRLLAWTIARPERDTATT